MCEIAISSFLRGIATIAFLALVTVTSAPNLLAQNDTWTRVKPTRALPGRAAFASAYDPISQKIVVFGGRNADGQTLNETWTYDGKGWSQVPTTVQPQPRTGASMAYDRRIKKLVLFGGFLGARYGTDTWLWDGATSTWTKANPLTVPPGSTGPMLFQDPVNGHVVMFGGYRGRFYSRDTYRWNGTDWRLLHPATSPFPRSFAVHAADPVHKNVVVFGGISDIWIVQNTWTWDGMNWTQQFPATQPPPLYMTSGAFDPVLGKTIVFGGGSEGVDQNTTWAWDGSDWTQLFPTVNPPIRELGGTEWDPVSQQLLTFGGTIFQTNLFYPDIWAFSGN